MKSIDLIRGALELTDQATVGVVSDMRDAALVRSSGDGGNHVLWTLGHLAFVEASIVELTVGAPHPFADSAALFAPGSEPKDDAAAYPSFDELLGRYRANRAETIRRLDEVGEAALAGRPKEIPPGFEEAMATVGQAFLLINLHNMMHYGQITDARRVAGRKPLL